MLWTTHSGSLWTSILNHLMNESIKELIIFYYYCYEHNTVMSTTQLVLYSIILKRNFFFLTFLFFLSCSYYKFFLSYSIIIKHFFMRQNKQQCLPVLKERLKCFIMRLILCHLKLKLLLSG